MRPASSFLFIQLSNARRNRLNTDSPLNLKIFDFYYMHSLTLLQVVFLL